MLKTGLVSVTFRKLPPEEIVKLVSKAGLDGIEWGGDIHVPHGDVQKAREVARMTQDEGLSIAAYGSYYRVGCEKELNLPFEKVLETAIELKAPTIRVWAGNRGSGSSDQSWWNAVIEESRRIASMALKEGITISYEYHDNTLTDTAESAYRLLSEVNHENIRSYWQPPVGLNVEERLEGLNKITPWLSNVHVFYWKLRERMPLEEGISLWQEYMKIIKTVQGTHYCMIEFVKDDEPGQFLKDAEALKRLI